MEIRREVVLDDGKKIVVHKATHLMSLQRASLTVEASNLWNGKAVDTIELQILKYDETVLYPSLIACSTGKSLPKDYVSFQAMSEEEVEN